MQRNQNKTSKIAFTLLASSLLIATSPISDRYSRAKIDNMGNHQNIVTNIYPDENESKNISNLSKIALTENAIIFCHINYYEWGFEHLKWNKYCLPYFLIDDSIHELWDFLSIFFKRKIK